MPPELICNTPACRTKNPPPFCDQCVPIDSSVAITLLVVLGFFWFILKRKRI